MLNYTKLILYFFSFGFVGWVCETVFCSIIFKKFINRGFLNGPICPIYAVGAILIYIFISPFSYNPIIVFLGSMILTSSIEYFTGWLLETIFHAKWWDYSHCKFNIKGRVCLKNSIIFGFMALGFIYYVNPFFESSIDKIPNDVLKWSSLILIVIFIVDICISTIAAFKLSDKAEKLQRIFDEIKLQAALLKTDLNDNKFERKNIRIKDIKQNQSSITLSKKKEELFKSMKHIEKRILLAFPNMKSSKLSDSFKVLHKHYTDILSNKKSSNNSSKDD